MIKALLHAIAISKKQTTSIPSAAEKLGDARMLSGSGEYNKQLLNHHYNYTALEVGH